MCPARFYWPGSASPTGPFLSARPAPDSGQRASSTLCAILTYEYDGQNRTTRQNRTLIRHDLSSSRHLNPSSSTRTSTRPATRGSPPPAWAGQPYGRWPVAGGRWVGTRLVAVATQNTRAAGCEWLHV